MPARAILLCPDLFFSSRLTGVAGEAGYTVETILRTDRIPDDLTAEDVVLWDLKADGEPTTLFNQVATDRPLIIAFGPHVQIGRLRRARELGCDHVLTHSQLDDRLPTLLADHQEAD